MYDVDQFFKNFAAVFPQQFCRFLCNNDSDPIAVRKDSPTSAGRKTALGTAPA
jgi:hypothetical protein